MDEYQYAKEIKKKYAVPSSDIINMLREEAEFTKSENKKMQYSKAIEIAGEQILYWLDHAYKWNTRDLISFVASHRRTCVWAVLLGVKQYDEKKENMID